jgi:hypothetical protein
LQGSQPVLDVRVTVGFRDNVVEDVEEESRTLLKFAELALESTSAGMNHCYVCGVGLLCGLGFCGRLPLFGVDLHLSVGIWELRNLHGTTFEERLFADRVPSRYIA